MSRLSLWVPFSLALFIALAGGAFFPTLKVWAFAPFLAIVYHRASLVKSLWVSFACGLLLDCLSTSLRFGLFGLSHVLTTFLLYNQKKHFFEDKAFALSLFTTLISFFLSAFVSLFSIWNHRIFYSSSFLVSDLILMPFLDGLYAFFWFTCPLSLILYFKKHGLRHLLKKETEDT